MPSLILFGGGDGGGIYIGADGKLHRIPPMDPTLIAELSAIAQLVKVSGMVGKQGSEVTAVTERIASSVIPQVLKGAGVQGGANTSVSFVSDYDDFVCGSTGKIIPVPIPRGVGAVGTTAGA